MYIVVEGSQKEPLSSSCSGERDSAQFSIDLSFHCLSCVHL